MIDFFQHKFFHSISAKLFGESLFEVGGAFAREPALHGLGFDGCNFVFVGVELDVGFFGGDSFALEVLGVLFGMGGRLVFGSVVAEGKIGSFSFEGVEEFEGGGMFAIFFRINGFSENGDFLLLVGILQHIAYDPLPMFLILFLHINSIKTL